VNPLASKFRAVQADRREDDKEDNRRDEERPNKNQVRLDDR
jgi:hypothetical protein